MLLFLAAVSSASSRHLLFGRPDDCPEKIWDQVVEAERISREKRFGALIGGLDKKTIEANQVRIWEELKRQKETGETTPPPKQGPLAGIQQAWKKIYEEADAMGYAQAVALSAKLENKGVLPRVVTKDGDDDPASDEPKKIKKKKKKKSRGFGNS